MFNSAPTAAAEGEELQVVLCAPQELRNICTYLMQKFSNDAKGLEPSCLAEMAGNNFTRNKFIFLAEEWRFNLLHGITQVSEHRMMKMIIEGVVEQIFYERNGKR
jgi:hypothetical protein